MRHIQIGLLSADNISRDYLANQWGKKGTTSDITLYTVVQNDITQTTVIPSGYPKKLLPLVISAHMSDVSILGVSKQGLNSEVGEIALLLDCLNMKGIRAVIGSDVKGLDSFHDQMMKVFSKLSLSTWPSAMAFDGSTAQQTREAILNQCESPRGSPDEYLAIEVDHTFPVQGVGSVILGTVINGTVHKGQKITAYPGNHTGTVRSIQVNDVDAKEAHPGTHVGLALKGILPKNLERGVVLGNPSEDEIRELEDVENLKVKFSAFGNKSEDHKKVHVVCGLYDTPSIITEWGNNLSIKFEKAIPFHPKTRMTILDLNKKPAILASKI
ncbi:MAG: EF-Tu/IF-2/RF-3 family GTPase [Candidatus Heimdallarchaeota archaeon]|nr:EF-Tu/IF-2/RF-3 family GTPase [Candidatus Heimdallarchaeota archaeon]